MALADNRTQLQDCEAVGDVAGDSTADPQSNTTEAGVVIEGSTALQFQVTNAQEYLAYDLDSAGATFNLDLSDSTIYLMIKDNLHDSFANLGAQIVLNDGADGGGGDCIGYNVAGYDVIGLPYEKKYSAIKLDVSVVVATPGTNNVDYFEYNGTEAGLDHTAILQVGYGSIHLIKGQGTIPNTFMDGIYYIANDSYAASITGGTTGTPETMVDLVGDDITVGAGMFSNPKGSEYGIFAPTEWGAATGDTAFEGVDQQWIYYGDNGGGHAVGATHFPMRLLGGTGTNIFRQTRVTNINIGTRAQFDMSDASFDEIELDTTTWVDFGVLTLWATDVSKFCNNSTFINGDQMVLSSADMDGNTWIGTTDANGAIIWDETVADQENQINSTFVRVGTHNAIEIAPTGAGPFTYDVDGLIVDGFASQDDVDAVETQKVFFINPATLSANININLANSEARNIGGGTDTGVEGFSYRVVGSYSGTVTITQTVTLAVTVADASDGSALEDVFVSIRNASTNALISEGRTNASGLYQDTGYNYTGDIGVVINVRKSSPGDTRYFPKNDGNTIISTGMNASVQMTEDTIAGAVEATRFDISKHGQISNDVSGAAITAKVKLPSGSRRKLVVGCGYWDSTADRAVTSLTYDGNAMTGIVTANAVNEGANWHEMFLYRYDIPDTDSGTKDVVLTLDGVANVRFLAFAVINLAGTGAEEDSATSSAQAVTSNPSLSLNNTSQPAIDVMFSVTDDMDTFPPAASGVGSIRRADELVSGNLQITIVRADRVATGAHSIGADYDASSKSYVSAGATFAD